MAEVTGSIGPEYVELENAATESTLQELLAASLLIARATGVKNDTQKAELTKLYASFKKLDKQAIQARSADRVTANEKKKILNEEAAQKKKNDAQEKAYLKQRRQTQIRLKNASDGLEKGFNGVVGALEEISNLNDSIVGATKMFRSIPLIGTTLSTSFGVVAAASEKTYSAFVKASSVGANFGGSVTTMVNAAGKAGLTFDQFAGIVASASEGLARLGNGTADGAIKFAKLGGQMRKEMATNGIADLGYTTESANENMARFITRLSKTGKISNLTTQQLANTSTKYLKNLDALSTLTGKSKDALQAEQDAMMADAQYRTMLADIGDGDTRMMVETIIGSLDGEMKIGAKELLATGTATSEAGQKFLAFMSKSGNDLGEVGKKLRAGGKLTEDEMASLYGSIQNDAKSFSKSDIGKTVGYFDKTMNEFVVNSHDIGTREIDIREALLQKKKAADKNDDKIAQNTLQAKQKIADASNRMSVVFASLLPKIEPILTTLMETLTSVGEFISNHGKLVGVAFTGLVATIGGLKLASALSKFKTGLSMFGAGRVGGSIGGGSGGGSGVASRAAVGFGKSIGAIGKGLGQGVAGILKGLALGLQAFANPQILLGAGILSGAIVIIGAGIAGAAWILGKALPTFAEGLSAFGDIDGGNLLKVGAGIAAIGAAMAVMGAGAVVGTFGSSLASLSEGITHFFGGKTPLDRLVEFSNLPIKLQAVKDNTKAVSAFAEGMAALSRIPSPSISKGISDTVGAFFESNAPYDRMVTFSNLALGPYTEQNVIALRQFAEASAIIKNIPKPTVGEALANTVASFLGFDIPYKKLVEFSNLSIGPDTSKNAIALGIFAEALGSMPEIKGKRAGGVVGAIISFFAGDKQMPWDKLDEFSKLKVNQAAVLSNAMALSAFGNAINLFDDGIPQGELFSPNLVDNIQITLTKLAGMSVDASAISANLQGLSSLDALPAAFDIINSLNIDLGSISTTSEALQIFRDSILSYGRLPATLITQGIYDDIFNISNMSLDVSRIINNSKAMDILYFALHNFSGNAIPGQLYQQAFIKDLRELGTIDLVGKNVDKNAKVLTTLGTALSWFNGYRAPLGLFGDAFIDNIHDITDLNVDIGAIKNNAKILEIIGNAIQSFNNITMLSTLFQPEFLQNIVELANLRLDIGNAKNTVEVIETFQSALLGFNDSSALDTSGIDSYNNSLKSLGTTLSQLTPEKLKNASNLMKVDTVNNKNLSAQLKELQKSGAKVQPDDYKKQAGVKAKPEVKPDNKNLSAQLKELQKSGAKVQLDDYKKQAGVKAKPEVKLAVDESSKDEKKSIMPANQHDTQIKNSARLNIPKTDNKELANSYKQIARMRMLLDNMEKEGPRTNSSMSKRVFREKDQMLRDYINEEISHAKKILAADNVKRNIKNSPASFVNAKPSSFSENASVGVKKLTAEAEAQKQAEKVAQEKLKKEKGQQTAAETDVKNKKQSTENQDAAINGSDSLNTRLDSLIGEMNKLNDINRKQLSVQQSLSNDVFTG